MDFESIQRAAAMSLKAAINLNQVQQDFATAFFSGDASADIETASQHVQAQGKLSAAQRVGIYRNSVHGILNQHLAALYPVCQQLIGGERFVLLCDVFIDQQPPQTPFLTEFGRDFAAFLAEYPGLKDLSWIVDVACLEWGRHAAWHMVNQPVSDFAELANLDEQQQAALCFALPKSAQLLCFNTSADEVWLAHQSTDAEQVSAQLAAIALAQETFIIIWRQGRKLQQSNLSTQQWQFLQAIDQGATLEKLSVDFGEDISILLSTSVQQGWAYSFL